VEVDLLVELDPVGEVDDPDEREEAEGARQA
jgi:hypothetical protein